MKTLDEAFDIYQDFLDSLDWRMKVNDYVKTLDDGKERAILELSNGFVVELLNDPKLEKGARLRCWWEKEENAVVVTTLEHLNYEFQSRS